MIQMIWNQINGNIEGSLKLCRTGIDLGSMSASSKKRVSGKGVHVTLDTYTDVFNGMNNKAVENLDKYLDSL